MRKNILFGDIVIIENKKQKTIKGAVFTEGDELYKNNKIIQVLNSKIVGQTSINKAFTEVKASDEKRNNITGAYE